MEFTDILGVSEDTVREEFKKNRHFICTIPYVNRESDRGLSRILKAVLSEISQEKLHSYLEYAQNELCMNASKANSKRLYFQMQGLDINNEADYRKGMSSFKKDVFDHFEKYEAAHREQNTYVRIRYEIHEEKLEIKILNNSPMVYEEKLRIAERIKVARQFQSLAEVLAYGFDDTEGAGYGLIVILQMLRKVNLDEKSLTFQNVGDSGCTGMTIPLHHVSREQGNILAAEIVREVDQMPQFPENIQILQKELSNPACTFESVSETITSDPSLATEILRIANSPVYRRGDKISDVSAAVSMIGMLGVKSILYNYGAKKVFEKRYNKNMVKEVNSHSFHVALIASFLAKYRGLRTLAEDIYISALIHDFGKIIVNALSADLEKKLTEICKEKHIPITLLEDLAEGYNHTIIGAELMKKWDFPEKFIQAILYHHTPLECSEENRALTYAVYLGNEIYYYDRKERDFHDLNYMVLQFFRLEKERDFDLFIEELKTEGLNFSL